MHQKEAYGPYEAVTLGIELEVAGYKFYSRVAEEATDYRVKNLFQYLADAEIDHMRVIKEEIKPLFTPEWYSEEDLAPLAEYLRDIEKQPVFPSPEEAEEIVRSADSASQAIEIGITAEERAMAYFAYLRDTTNDETGKEAFTRLHHEEVKHLKMLNDLKKELEG